MPAHDNHTLRRGLFGLTLLCLGLPLPASPTKDLNAPGSDVAPIDKSDESGPSVHSRECLFAMTISVMKEVN